MIKLTPTILFTLLLGAYALITLILRFSQDILIHALVIGIVFSLVFIISRKLLKKKFSGVHIVISALILFLLVSPGSTLKDHLFIGLIGALFLGFKFLRYKSMPIVNPIVLALIAAYFVTKLFSEYILISWWGTAYLNGVSIFFLLPAVGYAIYKFRKYGVFFSFFVAYSIVSLLSGQGILPVITNGTWYFLAGVMLLEPKTSPVKLRDQVWFGGAAGILAFVFLKYDILSPLLLSIAAVNALFLLQKVMRSRASGIQA
ncbi:MAG TPA: hypothetical protein VJH97_01250 [Candidatus Nanoarchaeia archaeon]|nr:hypothetical protein [Candidatus Nanoarchaeia archaeon]